MDLRQAPDVSAHWNSTKPTILSTPTLFCCIYCAEMHSICHRTRAWHPLCLRIGTLQTHEIPAHIHSRVCACCTEIHTIRHRTRARHPICACTHSPAVPRSPQLLLLGESMLLLNESTIFSTTAY